MKALLGALCAIGVMTSAASAADKPEFAPSPSWVRPVVAPKAKPASDEVPARVLLADQQIALEPGRITEELCDLGREQLRAGHHKDAVATFTAALELYPQNASALAHRGLAYVWLNEFESAGKDLDAAAKIDPDHPVIHRARGLMAFEQQDWSKAIKAFTVALEIEPESAFALGYRAIAAREIGDDSAALRDAEAALALNPDWMDLYDLRARIFYSQLRIDWVINEAATLTAANPNSARAHATAIYFRVRRRGEAIASYDRAIALEPKAILYIERGYARPDGDVAGRRADIEAALKLEPDNLLAQRTIGNMQRDQKDYVGAIEIYSKILAVADDDADALIERGVTYALVGDLAKAEADFQAVSKMDAAGEILTALCWTKASVRVVLESALSDCNTALNKVPGDSFYLINRGLALLQLGRYDEAIADYDRALSATASLSEQVEALYGRALAWARKGDADTSARDAAAARKIDPHIDETFERFGLKL